LPSTDGPGRAGSETHRGGVSNFDGLTQSSGRPFESSLKEHLGVIVKVSTVMMIRS
jgi:hypothetical protein